MPTNQSEEHLEQLLARMESNEEIMAKLLKKPDIVENGNKMMKLINGLIGLVAIVVSLGVTWGIVTTKTTAMAEDIVALKSSVHQLELAQAGDDKSLESIEKTLEEVRIDVRSLLVASGGK